MKGIIERLICFSPEDTSTTSCNFFPQDEHIMLLQYISINTSIFSALVGPSDLGCGLLYLVKLLGFETDSMSAPASADGAV